MSKVMETLLTMVKKVNALQTWQYLISTSGPCSIAFIRPGEHVAGVQGLPFNLWLLGLDLMVGILEVCPQPATWFLPKRMLAQVKGLM